MELLKEVIKRHIPNKAVWAYGSRVNWKASEISDLDLVVFGCNSTEIFDLREAFEESDLLTSVDVMDWGSIPENFKKNINRKYVVLQEMTRLEGWRGVKLEEVCEIVGGGTPKTKVSEYWNGKIPWITPRDLSNYSGRYIAKGARSISELGLSKSSAKLLPKGTVLLTTRAPVGYLAISEKAVSTNQGFRSLIPNKETDNLFLFYLLKQNVEYLKSQSEGTTFGELAGSTLKSLSFLFPPLTEQKAIAEILSSLDDKIDLLHRQNKTLENMAQTLFRKWFVEDVRGEWEEKKIGELAGFIKGRKPTRAENIQFECSAPQILIETFDTGKTLYSERDGTVFANSRDTLMVMDGASSGRVEIGFEGILGSTIGLYRVTDEFDYPFFIFCFFKYQEKYIKENTTGSAIPHTDKKLVSSLTLNFPNIKTVGRFDVIAESYFIKKQSNLEEIHTLENLRDTLLPKLMGGKVRIKQEKVLNG